MGEPNLSQYFANDPPSLFDNIIDDVGPGGGGGGVEIENNANQTLITTTTTTGNDNAMNIFGGEMLTINNSILNNQSQNFTSTINIFKPIPDTIHVTDDVRDMWEPAHTEPGIPPILTMPGVQMANDLADPIRESVTVTFGESEANLRKILLVNDVTQDERGLRQLIEAGCYRSAVNLTGRLLTIYGQGYGRLGQPAKHTPHSLQLWFTRLALFIKLGQFELCQLESESFGLLNRPDVYYEFYPEMYSGRKGSMACFSFRLLLAELPLHLNSPKICMDRLTELIIICSEIKSHYQNLNNENAIIFWQKRENRAIHSLINCSLYMKNFNLADHLMEKLTMQDGCVGAEKRALYSAWGRIFLQCGDLFGAEQKFMEASRMRESNTVQDLRDLIDKGLIAVARNEFSKAYEYFQKALQIDQQNIMLLNNMGICLLYSGKLKDAINLYENAVKIDPQKSLNENLLINLATLYELESSNDTEKKLTLLKLINRYKGDLNINLDYCLKLPTINKIT